MMRIKFYKRPPPTPQNFITDLGKWRRWPQKRGNPLISGIISSIRILWGEEKVVEKMVEKTTGKMVEEVESVARHRCKVGAQTFSHRDTLRLHEKKTHCDPRDAAIRPLEKTHADSTVYVLQTPVVHLSSERESLSDSNRIGVGERLWKDKAWCLRRDTKGFSHRRNLWSSNCISEILENRFIHRDCLMYIGLWLAVRSGTGICDWPVLNKCCPYLW